MAFKVGILSMQRICNYGSFLQAYGLKKIFEELGCKVEFADYCPGECMVRNDEGTGISRKIAKVKEIMCLKSPMTEKLRFVNYKRNYARNYYKFLGIDDSLHYAPNVDLMVIGSDEVFNCVQDNPNVGFTPELFGVGQTADKVISYAASFGNTTLEKLEKYDVKDKVAEWLKELDAISVRDSNSGLIVEELTGSTPRYNLDPVLMYDYVVKCKRIPKRIDESNYLLLYGYSGRFTKKECTVIRKYADDRKLKIVCIGGIQHCCDKFVDCDPFEVIAYFQCADCIVTDTFHGTILSVITHSSFVSIVRDSGYGNAEKLTDLLQRLHLSDRNISNITQMKVLLEKNIDYRKTDDVIAEERKYTYQYLQQFIK